MKRFIDILGSTIGLTIFSVPMLIVGLIIRIRMGKPVLFTQPRPGFDARPFRIIKFRTMIDARDEDGMLLHDRERLTGLGRFLRSTSFDELPELICVLKGDMSLVGPRPLLMEYLPLYTPDQMRRHEVKPGMTGWAQVNGREELPFSKRFELDVWYVDNHTTALDMKILVRTFTQVLKGKGVRSGQDRTDTDDLGFRDHIDGNLF